MLVGKEPFVGEPVASATGYTAGDDGQKRTGTTSRRTTTKGRRSAWKGIYSVCIRGTKEPLYKADTL